MVAPDLGVRFVRPTLDLGTLFLDLHLTRRGDEPRVGQATFALQDLKAGGLTWTFTAGDSYVSPAISRYGFTNLYGPTVTFTGGSITALGPRTSITAAAGRVTALRNIFGTDPEMLGQQLGVARVEHRLFRWLELSARGSRVRTSDAGEFGYTIKAGDEAGAGVRLFVTPAWQFVADGGYSRYQRRGSDVWERAWSSLVGTRAAFSRGWLQLDAHRFSPGDFPVLNSALSDREGLFAAGELDLASRLRVFGGAEAAQTNVDPAAAERAGATTPSATTLRAFTGLRVRIGGRSLVTLRGERGDRVSRPIGLGLETQSDTGVASVDWQSTLGPFTTFVRYERRENVNASDRPGTFMQQTMSGQIFTRLSQRSQLFVSGLAQRRDDRPGGGHTFWQLGTGGQMQLPGRNLWIRAESVVSKNLDLASDLLTPRGALNLGLSGQLTNRTSIGLDFALDRTPFAAAGTSPWLSRTMLRVTRTVPTGRLLVPSIPSVGEETRIRGTGTVSGLAFADWNANGELDPGEDLLSGIAFTLQPGGSVTTGSDGRFAFMSVGAGRHEVGVDVASLPVDFDPPTDATVSVELARSGTVRVPFGLIPLGTVEGTVMRDADGDGRRSDADEPIDGAVVVLDDGMRSELVREGRFRIDAVRPGPHEVQLVAESLPQGAAIAGSGTETVDLTRDRRTASVSFLVKLEQRPEIRRVFPPKPPGGGAAATTPAPGARTTPPARPPARTAPPPARTAPRPATPARPPVAAGSEGTYWVQVAALSQRASADALAIDLATRGYTAQVFGAGEIGASDALFRVRVGRYRTREEAARVAERLEADGFAGAWIVRAR
jgi:cell division septation protein DedD